MVKILIVEDEPQMRLGLKDNFEFEGYDVDFAEDGEKGLIAVQETDYDLIILDVMLPKISGFDLLKKMRNEGNDTPVIMLTAKGEEIDRVLGLELGADDYVTKPFSLRELLARVKAVLRRNKIIGDKEPQEYKIGNLNVNFAVYEASCDGNPVAMTHKEFEILKYFIDHAEQTISRDDLLRDVWGYETDITSRTVDNFILKLRQKIEFNPSHPRFILTVHGVGYKFIF
ncbi:MAG: response regulator transcription factor [Calditrichaceae bacterium]|nr:response regulator transcription factor [Calditrichaceae bacterium]